MHKDGRVGSHEHDANKDGLMDAHNDHWSVKHRSIIDGSLSSMIPQMPEFRIHGWL